MPTTVDRAVAVPRRPGRRRSAGPILFAGLLWLFTGTPASCSAQPPLLVSTEIRLVDYGIAPAVSIP